MQAKKALSNNPSKFNDVQTHRESILCWDESGIIIIIITIIINIVIHFVCWDRSTVATLMSSHHWRRRVMWQFFFSKLAKKNCAGKLVNVEIDRALTSVYSLCQMLFFFSAITKVNLLKVDDVVTVARDQ